MSDQNTSRFSLVSNTSTPGSLLVSSTAARVARQLIVATMVVGFGFLATSSAKASVYNDAVLADNPLFYWTFDEASGNAIEQTGATGGAPMVPTNGATRAASTSTTGGISLGRAASFDGINDSFLASSMTTAGNTFVTSQRWALEFWFRPDDGAAASYLFNAYRNPDNNNPAVIYNFTQDSGTPNLEYLDRDGNRDGTPIADDQWYHAVIAFYGNDGGFADNLREIYIDGVLTLSDTTSSFTTGFGLDSLEVGSVGGANAFAGLIDEVALYELGPHDSGRDFDGDRAFVAGIAAHFNVFSAPEPGSCVLMVCGLVGLALRRRARKRSMMNE
jgi:hypothetical protein